MQSKSFLLRGVIAVAVPWSVLSGLPSASRADDPTDASSAVEFNRDIRPILSNNCFHCHGPDASHREADLRLDLADEALLDRGGYAAIRPGEVEESEVWKRISTDDPDLVMPPTDSHKELSDVERDLLRRWIEQGAEYQGHWAFIPPRKSALPEAHDARFGQQPIDRFVDARLAREGLAPSPAATKEVLLRRVTLDLTGLPPTLEELDAFLADEAPNAYEKVVDRLLASPQFGERMAVHWLDAARYGDTSVFHADGPRDMWVWRDWVVEAFNRNLPYDQFTIHQLAGDLLPEPTWRELVATGFNRNNATTDEGGAIAEEFRVEYAVDRVKTTSMVWLGLSMECAQCHEHKYDPISQEDYYRFFAFFNQAADPGMQTRNGNQSPIVDVPDLKDQQQIPVVQAELDSVLSQQKALQKQSEPQFQQWTLAASTRAAEQVIPGDAVSYVNFNELREGAVVDEANPDGRGTLQGEAEFVAGKLSRALRTQNNQSAQLPIGDFERDQAFSVSVWVYGEKEIKGSPVARMDVGGGNRGYDFLLQPKEIEVHLIHAWPENAIKVQAAADLSSGKWHHLVMTYDGSSKAGGVSIYHNGTPLEVQVETDQLSRSIRTETPLRVGGRSEGAVFDGRVDELRLYDRTLTPAEVQQLASVDAILEILKLPETERTAEQTDQLRTHYLTTESAPYQELLATQQSLQTRLVELRKPLSTVMVMKDVETPRTTYVLKRGQYDSPDKERPVEPNTPTMLPELSNADRADRLALAQWIVRRDNPLTARVAVNRFWQLLFGTGIVKTLEEFGSQGEWPSHPELLDWLAVDFMENGWDVKALLKQIVMSETYRQTSRVTPELRERDPLNRLLARGPRFRLSAEVVRDQALAVSGLLDDSMGGPSVKPYQPPGLWSEVSLNPGVRFVQDQGSSLYRRSLYTYWKRSSPPPMMVIFDAPTREKCSVRRSNTNTPLQALVLMNDPQFMEAARAMAERLLAVEAASDEERIVHGYRMVTSRVPKRDVLDVLMSQLDSQRRRYSDDLDAATKLLSHGESARRTDLAPDEHAAWTILCSLLLNLDETVTRG